MFIYERKAKIYDKYRIADGDMSSLNTLCKELVLKSVVFI